MAEVIQYHPSVIEADAIGTSIQLLNVALEHAGIRSIVACEDVALGISVRGAKPASQILAAGAAGSFAPDDVILIHYSFRDPTAEQLAKLPLRKIMVFHNITPSSYFREVGQDGLAAACDAARMQLQQMSHLFDASVGDSDFNAKELRSAKYPSVDVIPILFDEESFSTEVQDLDLFHGIKTSADVNILFVGRFVPNKRIERIISTAAHFRSTFRASIRLHLVGKIWDQMYFASLVEYAARVSAADIISFHINADQRTLRTLYAAADAFVCMSDHEGFMVPLVEAFSAGCPVVALARAAVGETMSDAGLLVDEPDPELFAGLIHLLCTDATLRNRVIWSQGRRLAALSPRTTVRRWMTKLGSVSPTIAASLNANRA